MNERIQELALQAGFETNEANYSYGNYKVDQEYFFAEDFIEDELKKFAELIVKECMKVAREADGLDATHEAWYLIKQHFGVEE